MRPKSPGTCAMDSMRQDIYAGVAVSAMLKSREAAMKTATRHPYDPEGNGAEEAMKVLEAEYGPYETYKVPNK